MIQRPSENTYCPLRQDKHTSHRARAKSELTGGSVSLCSYYVGAANPFLFWGYRSKHYRHSMIPGVMNLTLQTHFQLEKTTLQTVNPIQGFMLESKLCHFVRRGCITRTKLVNLQGTDASLDCSSAGDQKAKQGSLQVIHRCQSNKPGGQTVPSTLLA